MKYEYAVFTNATNPDFCCDDADWYNTLDEAMKAAREAIEEGTNPDDVKVMKFDTDYGEVKWDFYITFDAEGGAWSDSYAAREEMGFIQ